MLAASVTIAGNVPIVGATNFAATVAVQPMLALCFNCTTNVSNVAAGSCGASGLVCPRDTSSAPAAAKSNPRPKQRSSSAEHQPQKPNE